MDLNIIWKNNSYNNFINYLKSISENSYKEFSDLFNAVVTNIGYNACNIIIFINDSQTYK